jgi:hypothetical protein
MAKCLRALRFLQSSRRYNGVPPRIGGLRCISAVFVVLARPAWRRPFYEKIIASSIWMRESTNIRPAILVGVLKHPPWKAFLRVRPSIAMFEAGRRNGRGSAFGTRCDRRRTCHLRSVMV